MHQQFDKDRLEVLVRAKSSGVQGILLCADTLDTAEENLKFISNNDWVKLTHKDSLDFFINDRLFTYRLTKNKITEDLSEKSHFYWMSGSAFEYAIEQFPIILEKFHSCGPGNTFKEIKKMIKL